MISGVVKEIIKYLHTFPVREATVKSFPVPVWIVSLTSCKPCWHTEHCSRNVSRPTMHLVCIDCAFSDRGAYCTPILQHRAAERQSERKRDTGSGGWWMSLAFFSFLWLQHRARIERWIVRQRVQVHFKILFNLVSLCTFTRDLPSKFIFMLHMCKDANNIW